MDKLEQRLLHKVHDLLDQVDLGSLEAKQNISMDISIAMDKDQRADLLGFICFMEKEGNSPTRILAEVTHDTSGMRQVYHGDKGFSPRSKGYAQYAPDL